MESKEKFPATIYVMDFQMYDLLSGNHGAHWALFTKVCILVGG